MAIADGKGLERGLEMAERYGELAGKEKGGTAYGYDLQEKEEGQGRKRQRA